ncbi:MAG: hypothetical protein DRI90_22755 [Deltaproteobacteria bacterium]|nr:MAG: hypothetical protein DRI90_22755 [Deltaproteobacteria bacterium]
MGVFKEFEVSVIRSLVGSALSTETIESVVNTSKLVSVDHTGVGYFVTVMHPDLPADRIVCDTPMISGMSGDTSFGFVIFLEDHQLTLECHSWTGGAIPGGIREQEVKLSGTA